MKRLHVLRVAAASGAVACLSLSLAWAAPASRFIVPHAPDVGAPTIEVLPETLPVAVVGTRYSQGLRGSGGTPPHSVFLLSEPPPDIDFNHHTLMGTPTTSGSFTFRVIAYDANDQTGEREYTLVIVDALTLPATTLPNAVAGVPYSAMLSPAAGGEPPYTYALSGGTLPAGLTLAVDGTIAGTPGEGGTFAFTVTVTDAGNRAATRDYAFAVELQPQTITFPTQAVAQRPFFPGSTFAVEPLATGGASGNPVTYASGSSSVCTLWGTTVTMIGPGPCVITANQAGGGVYAPAPPVSQTVMVFGEAAAVPSLSQAALALLAALLAALGLWRRRVH